MRRRGFAAVLAAGCGGGGPCPTFEAIQVDDPEGLGAAPAGSSDGETVGDAVRDAVGRFARATTLDGVCVGTVELRSRVSLPGGEVEGWWIPESRTVRVDAADAPAHGARRGLCQAADAALGGVSTAFPDAFPVDDVAPSALFPDDAARARERLVRACLVERSELRALLDRAAACEVDLLAPADRVVLEELFPRRVDVSVRAVDRAAPVAVLRRAVEAAWGPWLGDGDGDEEGVARRVLAVTVAGGAVVAVGYDEDVGPTGPAPARVIGWVAVGDGQGGLARTWTLPALGEGPGAWLPVRGTDPMRLVAVDGSAAGTVDVSAGALVPDPAWVPIAGVEVGDAAVLAGRTWLQVRLPSGLPALVRVDAEAPRTVVLPGGVRGFVGPSGGWGGDATRLTVRTGAESAVLAGVVEVDLGTLDARFVARVGVDPAAYDLGHRDPWWRTLQVGDALWWPRWNGDFRPVGADALTLWSVWDDTDRTVAPLGDACADVDRLTHDVHGWIDRVVSVEETGAGTLEVVVRTPG